MKIATYNLWHGLSPKGLFAFNSLEPEFRRKLREQCQIQELKKIAADVLFLQEVNPLGKRSEELTAALQMVSHRKNDSSGLRWMGQGIPINLLSGLSILVKPELSPRRLSSIKLSGPWPSFTGSWFSLQTQESRYALLTEIIHPKWGRVLLINVHLHHGLEYTKALQTKINALFKEGVIKETVFEEITHRLKQADLRRESEIKKLLTEIQPLQSRYNVILIAGDFNLTDQCEQYNLLKQSGFEDLASRQTSSASAPTWDKTKNSANHRFMSDFPSSVTVDDLSFDNGTRDLFIKILHEHETNPRRIDYVWAWTNSGELQLTEMQLFGFENDEGIAGSDHFGLLADIQ